MDIEYLDDHIDKCLAGISESLYKLQDELIYLHTMVELITFSREIEERQNKTCE